MAAVLSTEWDSVRQRARLSADASGAGVPLERPSARQRAELLGRLRWEVIQGGSLFLVYPQLLDGAAFADLRPAELLDELAVRAIDGGAALPLRVNARGADLAGQLIGMLTTGFVFYSLPLPESQCLLLHRELSARSDRESAAELLAAEGPAGAADRLLAATGVLDAPLRRRTVARWRHWLDAADSGLLRVSSLTPADYPAAYALCPPPRPDALSSTAGRAELEAWTSGRYDRNGLPNRSLLHENLDPLLRSGDAAERADAQMLRESFDETYYRAIAISEGCALGLSSPRRGLLRRETTGLPASTRVVLFPTRFELRLGLMTAAEWQRFTDEAADALTGWWRRQDLAALQEVGDLLAGRTKEPASGGEDEVPVTRLQRFVRQASGATAQMVAGGGMSAATGILGGGLPGAFAAGAGGALAPMLVAAVTAGVNRLGSFRGRYDVIELPSP
ncbi:hypothetical protein ABZY90_00970 [Streptomyces sp. NPDC006422]|uniref:hypothetical protein n=1 Tax=unclassified Streptomyces TaxID=2593676 RepID=UPI0033BE61B7